MFPSNPTLLWSHLVFFALYILTTPPYLLILYPLMKLRISATSFRTTFDTLLLQQGIADNIALSFYFWQRILILTIPSAVYDFDIVNLADVFNYVVLHFMIIRSFGISLLAIQRFLTIVLPNTHFTYSVQKLKNWKIWIVYWTPPILINLSFCHNSDKRFVSREELNIVGDQETANKDANVAITVLTLSCLVCLVCYALILKTLREKVNTNFRSMKRELRIAIQVALLIVALLILLLYMVLLKLFNDNANYISIVRPYTSSVNGGLSFISPISIMMFNQRLSESAKQTICNKKKHLNTGVQPLNDWKV